MFKVVFVKMLCKLKKKFIWGAGEMATLQFEPCTLHWARQEQGALRALPVWL